MLFCMKVSIFRKKFLIKDSMCGVENNISLYITHKVIVKYSLHVKTKAHKVSLKICRVWKLHAISLVM